MLVGALRKESGGVVLGWERGVVVLVGGLGWERGVVVLVRGLGWERGGVVLVGSLEWERGGVAFGVIACVWFLWVE